MMTVDRLRAEGAITFTQATALLREILGKKPAKATLIRWHLKGSRGARLAAQRVGNCFYTTRPAVEEFVMAFQPGCDAGRVGQRAPSVFPPQNASGVPGRLAQRRCQEVEQAKARLRQQGLRFLLVC
jgi:hypothetical protein